LSRRCRTAASAVALALLGLRQPPALAQSVPAPAVELEQFHASPFSDRTLRLDGTTVLPVAKVRFGLDADYALRPLVVTDPASTDAGSIALVRHAVGLGLHASVGLGKRLELGALLPVTAYQTGDALAGVAPPTTTGLEAARVGLKAELLGDGTAGPGLGVSLLAVIPTGSAGGLVREDGFGGEGKLFGDFRAGAFTAGLGAGVRLRRATQLYDLALGNELTAAASADLRLGLRADVFGELAGATPLASPARSARLTPLELLLGGRTRVGALTFFGGAGPGLRDGYGTPVVRVVAGASWSTAPLDADHDGVPDDVDRCPLVPEDRDGFEDADGCPDPDNDKDGIMDDVDKCPTEPEDKDGFEDADGCPDPDNDKDGIPDVKDQCPNEPETINNVKDDDGCPDKGIVTLKEGELETLTPIFFATDRARVRHAFRPALDDIAAILKAHPEIGRCAIEGHTDATGPAAWNQKLSLARAQAVATYLVGKGVDPGRVVAIGQGNALPWASNQTEAGRAANRRVIFHIEGVSDDQEKKQLEIQRARGLKTTGPGTSNR
jgi:large repetitive protein